MNEIGDTVKQVVVPAIFLNSCESLLITLIPTEDSVFLYQDLQRRSYVGEMIVVRCQA